MNRITIEEVDDFISSFKGTDVPLYFIDSVVITYDDNAVMTVRGHHLKRIFEEDKWFTPFSILKKNENIRNIDITIDKSAIFVYLNNLDILLKTIVRDKYRSIKKKSHKALFCFKQKWCSS